MPTPFEISDRLTDSFSDARPEIATMIGVSGRDHLWGDWSPEGFEGIADICRQAVADLSPHRDHPERREWVAARVVTAAAEETLGRIERGEHLTDLNHIYSPVQIFREVFDLMDPGDEETWDAITTRLSTVSAPLESYRRSLQEGLDAGRVVARRQVESVIEQARSLESESSRFVEYIDKASQLGRDPGPMEEAVSKARESFGEMADWLESEYLPAAAEDDGAGRDRYVPATDYFLGISIDPDETYKWGWDEVFRIREEMVETAAEIDRDRSIEEVIQLLDTDPERAAPNHQAFAEFVEQIQAEAVEQLAGEHFDVPDELRTVKVNISVGDGALGAWYHGPSEDLSRPGSIWYAPGSRTAIPLWQEVTTAYHEGFPGHHLQVGIATMLRDQLSRFQRLYLWKSGSGEGWALYAERLMDELGFFAKPEYRLGLLASQLFRAVRVVVDIGCHLGLDIPANAPLHPGEKWNYEVAVDYMDKIALQERDVAESEVKRYLGWYGQAISYKVGEREILKIRRERMARDGDSFDLKRFHQDLLEAGSIRLDQVRELVL